MKTAPMSTALLTRVLLWLWFAGAVAAGHWLLLAFLPPLALPALALALGGLAVLAGFRFAPLRQGWEEIDLRTLVLLHVIRLIGVYFMVLHQDGVLPRAFAIPAGASEVAVAVMALPVALAPLDEPRRRRAVRIWGFAGLLNLLFVVFMIARLNLTAPLHLRALATLPLSLYPTFLLPLLLATGVFILHRAGAFSRRH